MSEIVQDLIGFSQGGIIGSVPYKKMAVMTHAGESYNEFVVHDNRVFNVRPSYGHVQEGEFRWGIRFEVSKEHPVPGVEAEVVDYFKRNHFLV